MIQDTIKACKEEISFRKNVTDYQTTGQKATLRTLLAISLSCLLMFVYQLYRQSSEHAAMSLLGFALLFAATLLLSRAINTGIIRKLYPKHYRSWFFWDRKGLEKEWIARLEDVFKKRKIKARKRNLLISSIDQRISDHKKQITRIHTVCKELQLVLLGTFLSGVVITLVISLLIAAFWLLAVTVWDIVGTFSGIEDLIDLQRLISEASFVS